MNKNLTEITVILVGSGLMPPDKEGTIAGLNEFLCDQHKPEGQEGK